MADTRIDSGLNQPATGVVVAFTILGGYAGLILFLYWIRRRMTERGLIVTRRRRVLSEKGLTAKQRVALYLNTSGIAQIMDAAQIALAILSFCLYVYGTYSDTRTSNVVTFWLDVFFSTCFLFDILLSLQLAEIKWRRFISFFFLTDVVSLLPLYLLYLSDVAGLQGKSIYSLRILRALRLLRIYRLLRYMQSGLEKHIFTLIFAFLAILSVAASSIQVVERELGANENEDRPFHEWCYFIIVATTTVGYGDIIPTHDVSRMLMMLMFAVTIILIPTQTGKLLTHLNARSSHEGRYHPKENHNHILLCGHMSPQCLTSFFREFFSERNSQQTQVVILNSEKPSFEIKALLQNPAWYKRITYLQGSPMVKEDLLRASAETASSLVVLGDKHAPDPSRHDAANVLFSLSLRNLGRSIPTFVQLAKEENVEHLVCVGDTDAIQVIVIEQMKMQMLAMSCICPGFSTMITNLLRSYATRTDIIKEHWRREYIDGMRSGIYTCTFPRFFCGRSFSEVALMINCDLRLNAILFAVERDVIKEEGTCVRQTILWPGESYRINERDIGFLIAADQDAPSYVSTFDPNEQDQLQSVKGRWITQTMPGPGSKSQGVISVIRRSAVNEARMASGALAVRARLQRSRGSSANPSSRTTLLQSALSASSMDGESGGDPAGAPMAFRLSQVDPSILPTPDRRFSLASESIEEEPATAGPVNQRILPHVEKDEAAEAGIELLPVPSSGEKQKEDSAIVVGPEVISSSVHSIVVPEKASGSDGSSPAKLSGDLSTSVPLSDTRRSSRQISSAALDTMYKRQETCTRLSCIDLQGHVLVCGAFYGLHHFVTKIRERSVDPSPVIVIVAPTPVPTDVWKRVAIFDEVYYCKGNPLRIPDLVNAGIVNASKVVVLGGKAGGSANKYVTDADVVFAIRGIQANPDVDTFVMAEIVNVSNMKFMRSDPFAIQGVNETTQETRDIGEDYVMNTNFASGHVFSSSILDALLSQMYADPRIHNAVQELLGNTRSGAEPVGGQIYQINIPDEFKGFTFGEFFLNMLENFDILPLALYRYQEAGTPYVYTNPQYATFLQDNDLVICLAQEEPYFDPERRWGMRQ